MKVFVNVMVRKESRKMSDSGQVKRYDFRQEHRCLYSKAVKKVRNFLFCACIVWCNVVFSKYDTQSNQEIKAHRVQSLALTGQLCVSAWWAFLF